MELILSVIVPDDQPHWQLPELLGDMRKLARLTGTRIQTKNCDIVYEVWLENGWALVEFNGDRYASSQWDYGVWRKILVDGTLVGESLT